MSTIDQVTVNDATIPGLTYQVRIVADDDSSPDDADCYDDADRAAWRNDDWCYVGVTVVPTFNGVTFDVAEAQLWFVEYGTLPGAEPIDTERIVNVHPGPDLIADVRSNLSHLRPTLMALVDALSDAETVSGGVRAPSADVPAADPDDDTNPFDHDARPGDDADPGDRCRDCGRDITWMGPTAVESITDAGYFVDWLHCDDPRN